MEWEIKKIDDASELEDCARVIRDSFITVANEMNLTRQNAPTNPAFIEASALLALKEKGIAMYGGYREGRLIGFVVIEKANEDVYYMEKLAVLPEFRHHHYGGQLLHFVFGIVKEMGGRKVSIGIINSNIILKNWYIKHGFTETGTKSYPHLPFEVCFMEKAV